MNAPATWPVGGGSPSDVLLADGTIGVVRRVTPTDRDDVVRLHESLAPDNVRLRFFSVSTFAPHQYAEHVMASCDGGDLLALGLWRQERLLGVATAEAFDATGAEIAVVVSDAEHGLGIGTLLLEHLAAAARGAGIRRFTAEVLADNAAMLQVVKDAGFTITRRNAQGVVSIEMDTAETPVSLAAADLRDSVSEAASLGPLLSPGRVAVVGVRRDGTGVGAAILSAILDGGFTGSVVAVHPSGPVSTRVPTVASFDELDAPRISSWSRCHPLQSRRRSLRQAAAGRGRPSW